VSPSESNPTNSNETVNALHLQMAQQMERIYLYLERICITEAKNFSDSGRANFRRAQAELQRVRLLLYDLTGVMPESRIK
jgi:hypothetical protein